MSRLFHQLIAGLPVDTIKRISALQFSHPALRAVIEAGTNWMRRRYLRIRHGIGRGLMFNAGGSNVGYALGTTEPNMQQAIAEHLKPGDTFYDIGAHVGFFSVLAAKLVGPEGAVYAFEPLPENVLALRHNQALNAQNHLHIFENAVSSSAETLELQLVGNSTGPMLTLAGVREDSRGSLMVQSVEIDGLRRREGLRPPTLVKIDVEGAELEVIRGMAQTLQESRPVVLCEMHGKNREYVALMDSLGYDVQTLVEGAPVEDAYWNVHTVALPRS